MERIYGGVTGLMVVGFFGAAMQAADRGWTLWALVLFGVGLWQTYAVFIKPDDSEATNA